jgi:hemin uptake protein HemP
MKINTTLKNTKADKATKHTNLIGAHKRYVRHSGKVYLMTVLQVGPLTLGTATNVLTKEEINISDKSTVAQDIRKLCENRLYS